MMSCEVQIPRSPGTLEPGAPSRQGQSPQTCPGLLGREEHALSGAAELRPVTSSSASLWVWSIVWMRKLCYFMKVASDHVIFFYADFSKDLSSLVYLVQRPDNSAFIGSLNGALWFFQLVPGPLICARCVEGVLPQSVLPALHISPLVRHPMMSVPPGKQAAQMPLIVRRIPVSEMLKCEKMCLRLDHVQ